ncbi:uncharacterized protein RJT20DRAFT_57488 [Scheffersomyces xylosifermentans]|uniref:uncharacterized protein n=1 Tax=Scheffersomyces xylosifermentans TaxID=1304137 RepID=UPI00315DD0E3
MLFSVPQSLNLDVTAIHSYPALTVGLALFTFILLLLDVSSQFVLSNKFSLYPGAIGQFDLNRVSFYPLFHIGLFHWLLNILSIFTPMAIFERTHGTVYTGITLNVIAVVAAIQFSLVGIFLYPQGHVVGLSGYAFTFFAWLAYKEHENQPKFVLYRNEGREVSIPTIIAPVVFLFLCALLIPGSSFWGHLFGLTTGYLLGMDYLKVLYPPSKVILWIESKVGFLISKLDGIVVYYKEEDAVHARGVSYTPILSEDIESATTAVNTEDGSDATFRGEGHVLGA